jgi:acetyl-CoA acyltransferase
MIGSGVEHMGHLPIRGRDEDAGGLRLRLHPELMAKHNIVGQGIGAEMIADQWEISRSELDELAVRSQQLAHQATEEGRFEREIVPMIRTTARRDVTDQGIRPDTSLETLSPAEAGVQGGRQDHRRQRLADLRRRRRGAADVARRRPNALGLKARARIVDQTTVGVRPGEDARPARSRRPARSSSATG